MLKVKIIKSFYITGNNGSYFEFQLSNKNWYLMDTVSDIYIMPVFFERRLAIKEVINKYGKGEKLERPVDEEYTEKSIRDYVGK